MEDDGLIASLLINNYCHAIFDFESKADIVGMLFPKQEIIGVW